MTQTILPKQRVLAIDIFRGLTIAFMIIVNTPGNGERCWEPLKHAAWHGFTPTDLVFPSFLFIIGVSAYYSFRSLQGSEIIELGIFKKIWRRTLLLFLVGMLMWYVPGFIGAVFGGTVSDFLQSFVENVRVLGVLGRLALCYGIGASIVLFTKERTWPIVGVLLLMGYWGIMRLYGTGPDPYSLETNAALKLDLFLLGGNHLYHGEQVNGKPFAFDPEGILSTIPAVVTFLIGYSCGRFIDKTRDSRKVVSDLFPVAFSLIALGLAWDQWFGFPINKKLWTSSYTLFVGGLSMMLLAQTIWLTDIRGYHTNPLTKFFVIFGKNPLLAYLVSELGLVILGSFTIGSDAGARPPLTAFQWLYTNTTAIWFGDNGWGSFAFSMIFMLSCWLVSWIAHKRSWILKIS